MFESKWDYQIKLNDELAKGIGLTIKQIETIIAILEDHEEDMTKMANRIIQLENEISELKQGR